MKLLLRILIRNCLPSMAVTNRLTRLICDFDVYSFVAGGAGGLRIFCAALLEASQLPPSYLKVGRHVFAFGLIVPVHLVDD